MDGTLLFASLLLLAQINGDTGPSDTSPPSSTPLFRTAADGGPSSGGPADSRPAAGAAKGLSADPPVSLPDSTAKPDAAAPAGATGPAGSASGARAGSAAGATPRDDAARGDVGAIAPRAAAEGAAPNRRPAEGGTLGARDGGAAGATGTRGDGAGSGGGGTGSGSSGGSSATATGSEASATPPATPKRLTPQDMVADLCLPAPGGALIGRPLTLLEAVSAAKDRVRPAETVQAYWKLCGAVGEYRGWLSAVENLRRIDPQPQDVAACSAARVEALEQLRAAEKNVVRAQQSLLDQTTFSANNALPLPLDAPHAGQYRTIPEQDHARRNAPPLTRLLQRLIPLRRQAVEMRVKAIVEADGVVEASLAAYGKSQTDLSGVVRWIHHAAGQRRLLAREIEYYNDDIVDYVLGVMGPQSSPAALVGMLIRMRTEGAIRPTPAPPEGSQSRDNRRGAASGDPLAEAPRTAPRRVGTPVIRDSEVAPTAATAAPDASRRPSDAGEPKAGRPLKLPASVDALDEAPRWQGGKASEAPRDRDRQPLEEAPRFNGGKPASAAPQDAGRESLDEAPRWNGAATSDRRVQRTAYFAPAALAAQASPAVPAASDQPGKADAPARAKVDLSGAWFAALSTLTDASAQAQRLGQLLYESRDAGVEPARAATLRDMLAAVTANDRRGVIDAYWLAAQRQADRDVWQRCVDALKQLAPMAAEQGAQADGAIHLMQLTAMQRAAEAQLFQAQAAVAVAQFDLVRRTPRSVDVPWPLAITPPHAGPYKLDLEPLPPALRASPAVRRLEVAVPSLHGELVRQSTAVLDADRSRSAAVSAYRTQPRSIEPILALLQLETLQALAYLDTLTAYNRTLAEYALTVLPPGITADNLVQTLVLTKP